MTDDPQVAGPQTDSAVVAEPPPSSAPDVLDATQRVLLKAVLNRLIPSHADVPGAGDLGVAASIERTLSESARLRRLFLDGLANIQIVASQPFAELDPATQIACLEQVEHDHPAFFAALVDHAYRGYYTLASVQQAIGFPARPPQPLGHTLPPFDPALLALQRTRVPFWRRPE